MRTRISSLAIATLLALALASPALAQAKTEVVNVEVRPGVTVRYLAVSGGGQPRAAVMLFAGGDNVLRLSAAGEIGTDLRLNFLVRSRSQFAAQGLYVAVIDAPSDQMGGMVGDARLSAQYTRDMAKVIADVKKRSGAPVWLIGTSSSTISAAAIGARLSGADAATRPRGIVLSAVQSTLVPNFCGRTVYNANLAAIRMPVLVVSHRDDGCACSPGTAAAGSKLLSALSGATAKEHKIFTGGSAPISGPCEARAPHGFFGIEANVVKAIADWIKSH